MKKLLSILLIICCLTAFCACGASTPDTSSANQIVYGEKYIYANEAAAPKSEQEYYIINKNSIKYYCYYEYSKDIVYHYTVTYKYEIMDEGTLAYFFDSIEIYDDDTKTRKDENTTHGILMFSKNVIYTDSGNLFIRESYLKKELKNFGK